MSLDFLNITDRHGVIILFIHDGTERGRQHFERLYGEVTRRTRQRAEIMSIKDDNAQKLVEHYHLRGRHFVLLIRNSDKHLHHVWHDDEHLDASHIMHLAEQAG